MAESPRQRRAAQRRPRGAPTTAARRDDRASSHTWVLGVALCVLVAGFAIAQAAGGDDDEPTTTVAGTILDGSGDPIVPQGPSATFAAGPPVDLPAPDAGAAIDGAVPCPAADGSSPRTTSFSQAPPTCIDAETTYTAIVETTKGPLRILLNQDASPAAVNSFIVLARYHYYDDVPFHIVAPRGIIQGGDPVGDPIGSGNPGYLLPAEIDPEFPPIYPTLTVAAAAEGPDYDQIGSQFFIALGDEATALDPVHPVLGLLTDGMDAARAIEATGNPETRRPTEDVRITSVTILES